MRVTQQFLDRLDELLPAERTADGRPSAIDFLVYETPLLIEELGDDFEGSTVAEPSQPFVRALIASGIFVPFFAVYAELAEDGAAEAFYLDVG